MNEDGKTNVENIRRKGHEIANALQVEGGKGIEKLFKVAADSGSVSSSVLQDAIMAVKSIVRMAMRFNFRIQSRRTKA